jgi:hypothetical protein
MIGDKNISMQASTEVETLRIPPLTAPDAVIATTAAPSTALELLRKLFSFPAMLGALLAGAAYVWARRFQVDPDMWWHVKVGDVILKTHHWPTADPYSFTVFGQHWLAYEWLGEVLFSVAHRLGGLRGLEMVLWLFCATVLIALYSLGTLRSGKSKAGFVAAVLLFLLAMPSFSVRPQMLGYLFLILTATILLRFRQGKPGAIWLLPAMMVLWVNSHGSWIIGLGAIFVYLASGFFEFQMGNLEARKWTPKERKTLSIVFLLCIAVLPITPYGFKIALSPFEFAFSLPLNVQRILEWQPMPFNLPGGKIFLGLLIVLAVVQVLYRFTWRLEELALFLFGAAMACLHIRFLLIFVPFAVPVIATMIAKWIDAYNAKIDKYALNVALMAAVAGGIIFTFPKTAKLEESLAKDFPIAAVEYLNQHPAPEPMYNTYGFGGYLVWSRGPEHKVFLDGRGDVYERGGVLADYLKISDMKPETLALLDRYKIQSCLLQHDEALVTLLSATPGWTKVYSDETAALFVRTSVNH